MISLLHLDGLYNNYVRPYFDPIPETDDEGNEKPIRQKKKKGLSKGYGVLLEDCIGMAPLSPPFADVKTRYRWVTRRRSRCCR